MPVLFWRGPPAHLSVRQAAACWPQGSTLSYAHWIRVASPTEPIAVGRDLTEPLAAELTAENRPVERNNRASSIPKSLKSERRDGDPRAVSSLSVLPESVSSTLLCAEPSLGCFSHDTSRHTRLQCSLW